MFNIKKFLLAIGLVPKPTSEIDTQGELEVLNTDGKLRYHNGSSVSPVVTESHTATLTNKTIDSDLNTLSNIKDSDIKADAEIVESKLALDYSTSSLNTAITDHITQTTGAHAASAISNTPSGNLAATNVQAALNELQSDVDTRATTAALNAHINNTTGAHAASAISNTPSGNLESINVQTALYELQSDIDSRVSGPSSAVTADALARFDGTTGKIIKNSAATLTDAGAFSLTGLMNIDNLRLDGNTISSTNSNGNITLDANGTGNIIIADDAVFNLNLTTTASTVSTTGSNVTLAIPSTAFVRLTGAGLTSVDMIIAAPSDEAGSRVVFTNATGGTVVFNNETGATAANQILTGNGLPLRLENNASVEMIYDGTSAKWKVISVSNATSISNTPSGNLEATTVQDALNELQGDVDERVVGPASATNLAIARFNGTTGKIIQSGTGTITTAGAVSGLTGIVSSGTSTFSGAVNFSANTTDSATTGSSAVIATQTSSVIRLTNSSLVSIAGYANTTGGRRTVIINATGSDITVENENLSITAAQRIVTGTGSSVTLKNGASIELIYNATTARHQLIGGVGSGGVGGINYIENPDFEENTTGWSTYLDPAGVAPVDGTGGDPEIINITIDRSTASPLRGIASLLITKPGLNAQGSGVSTDFSIDAADLTKLVDISFDYTTSANYADGDFRVYIVSKTVGTVIELVQRDLFASNNGTYTGRFQALPNDTEYRLVLHCAVTYALAFDVKIDNVRVGPSAPRVKGPVVTDWQSYTPTITASTGSVTNATWTGRFRRVGDTAEVRINGIFSATSAAFTTLLAGLPSGLAVDGSKIVTSANAFTVVGHGSLADAGVGNYTATVTWAGASGQVRVDSDAANQTYVVNGGTSNTTPFTFNSGDSVNIEFRVPILGWSSNLVLSEDAGNREVLGIIRRDTAQTGLVSGTMTQILLNVSAEDTSSMVDTTNNRIIVPETGTYDIEGEALINMSGTASRMTLELRVGGSARRVTRQMSNNQGNSTVGGCYPGVRLNRGELITLWVSHEAGANRDLVNARLTIAKRASPQTIASGETVAVRATPTIGQSIASGTFTQITVGTKGLDTHNALASSGTFTSPMTRLYSFVTQCNLSLPAVAGTMIVHALKNGVVVNESLLTINNVSNDYSLAVSGIIHLAMGETLAFRVFHNTGGNRSVSTAERNSISIVGIGNL
jgi:hypothetical protein